MSERVNRKDLIVETATQLFTQRGYRATSTRQIAEAVGCTEAALYYHFKDGKRGLLHAVMDARMPEVQTVIEKCRQATSLKEAMSLFGKRFSERSPGMRWLMMELPHLSDEERKMVLKTFSEMRNGLLAIVRQFVPDERDANHIAWLVLCIGSGYQQLFAEVKFPERVAPSMQDLMEAFVALMK